MSRENTRYGAYDVSFEEEISRTLEELKKLGIRNATKLEVTALIANKNKLAKMEELKVKDFFERMRGLK